MITAIWWIRRDLRLTDNQALTAALQQADQITQKNATIAEETASAAEELANQAHQLQHSIAFFTIAESSQRPMNNHGIAPHQGEPKKNPLPEKNGSKERAATVPSAASLENISFDGNGNRYDAEFERY